MEPADLAVESCTVQRVGSIEDSSGPVEAIKIKLVQVTTHSLKHKQ